MPIMLDGLNLRLLKHNIRFLGLSTRGKVELCRPPRLLTLC